MTILCLPKYGDLAASTRQRFIQYKPALEEAGIDLVVDPLLDNAYLSRMYAGGRVDVMRVASAYFNRYIAMGKLTNARLIWLHYEALPYLPWSLERRVFKSGLPIVFDIDDAVFHRYDQHANRLVRSLLGSKIDRVMQHSRVVFAGNDYLAERALRAGATNVHVVPTVLSTELYSVAEPPHNGKVGGSVVGWIGAPSTWREYMEPMMPLIGAIATERNARILAVGAGKAATTHPRLVNRSWSEETEVSLIQEMDIGVMPLTDTPWSRGKCGYKLIQYMACGLPVVASPVGVNAQIVEHGVNGFLASTEAEWRSALNTLITEPALRRRMGEAGRRKVEERYSLRVWGPRVAALLGNAMER